MSCEVAGRVERRWMAVDGASWPASSSSGTELRDPQQVVGGADQVGGEAGPLEAPIARAAEVPDRLDPAEDLLDPLADALAHRVSGPTSGAMVECRATPPQLILRHVGSDVEIATACHEPGNIVTLVAGHCDPARPAQLLKHLKPLLAFGPTSGLTHSQIDHYAVAILHQHTLAVTELGLFAGALLGQPRFGVGGRLMSRVLAPLAVEVHARIARIIRWRPIAALLTLGTKALERRPRLDQRPVHRKVLVAGQLQLAGLCHYGTEELARYVVLK